MKTASDTINGTVSLSVSIFSDQDAVGEVLDLKVGKARNTRFSDRKASEPICYPLDVDCGCGGGVLQGGFLLTSVAGSPQVMSANPLRHGAFNTRAHLVAFSPRGLLLLNSSFA